MGDPKPKYDKENDVYRDKNTMADKPVPKKDMASLKKKATFAKAASGKSAKAAAKAHDWAKTNKFSRKGVKDAEEM